jgi:hypothetical protein
MYIRKLLLIILTASYLTVSGFVHAFDLVVVTHPNNGIEKMSKDDVINIYMGRYRKMPNGVTAMPLDLKNPLGEKEKFYRIMVGKELAEINSYWARLMFSGQGSPPLQAENMDEVMELIKNNKGALAYMDKKKVDKRVRVVYDPAQ